MSEPIELLNAYLDGKELDQHEARALSDWAAANPDNARAVVELAIIHSHIQYWMSVPGFLIEFDELMNPVLRTRDSSGSDVTPAALPKAPSKLRRAVRYLALAGCVLFAAFGLREGFWLTQEDERTAEAPAKPDPPAQASPAVVVATVTEALAVVSRDGQIRCGTLLRLQQPLDIDSGVLALTSAEGCRLVVEGPATLHFETPKQIKLDSGRLTARVEGNATGLTVITPTAKVVDLGTEFGVAVNPVQETRVAVYEGAAELYGTAPHDGDTPPSRRIDAGRAGFVAQHGELLWAVQTLPSDREFIRPDEIESLRRAKLGSAEAAQQLSYYALQRTAGLLAFQSFDIPSRGEEYALSFKKKSPRSKTTLTLTEDLAENHLYASGALLVGEDQEVFLDLDTSNDSPLARARLLTERGHVGRSGTELWLSWKTKMLEPERVGNNAGLALMFGDQRMVQEPVFFGYSDNRHSLSAVVNLGSRPSHMELDSDPNSFKIDHLSLNDSVRPWVLQIIFGERSDKVAVWCDVPIDRIRETRPCVETLHSNVIFDRLQLRNSQGASPQVFDDVVMATNLEALSNVEALLEKHDDNDPLLVEK